MTIDFKGVFRNKSREQGKFNDLERLESRRWVNGITHGFVGKPSHEEHN
jgi:hypothetical protein